MRTFMIFLTSLLAVTLFPLATSGQANTFTNKSVDYVIEFPSSKWRALPSSGIIVSARTRKEFIYSDANTVRLLVRRKFVDVSVTPLDMVRRRQIWAHNLTGFVSLKEECFTGASSDAKFYSALIQCVLRGPAIIFYLEADKR